MDHQDLYMWLFILSVVLNFFGIIPLTKRWALKEGAKQDRDAIVGYLYYQGNLCRHRLERAAFECAAEVITKAGHLPLRHYDIIDADGRVAQWIAGCTTASATSKKENG